MAPESFITYHRDEEALTIIGHLMDSHNKHGHTLNDISFKLQELEEKTTTGSSLSGGTVIEITNDNVNNLLQEGSNIIHTYDDIANTLTISTSMDPTFDTVDSPIVFTAVADVNIIRGQVVYISGTAGNGSTPTVDLALASNTTKMPAFGMARDDVSAGDTIKIVTFGSLYSIGLPSTITFALGDTLYVSSVSAGAYTNVPPGGESNLIQNIGKVQRIGPGSSSVIKVGGAGRTNATSNLNSGNIFYGNSSDQAVTATLTGGNNVTITHDSVSKTLTISALGTTVSGITVVKSTDNIIPNNTNTTITFNQELKDTHGWFSSPSTTVTPNITGTYLITANVLNLNSTNRGLVNITRNGIVIASHDSGAGMSVNDLSASVHENITSGQTIAVVIYQNSGSTKTCDVTLGVHLITT